MEIEFKVGDKVRIRQWDDMAEEFGQYGDGDIECELCFTRNMKELCGENAVITGNGKGEKVYLEFENESELLDTDFEFSEDMLELAEEE